MEFFPKPTTWIESSVWLQEREDFRIRPFYMQQ